MPERSTAEYKACPQRDRIGRVRGNCGDSGEEQSGKRNKAAAAGDGIHDSGEDRSQKQNRRIEKIEVYLQDCTDVELCFPGSGNSCAKHSGDEKKARKDSALYVPIALFLGSVCGRRGLPFRKLILYTSAELLNLI